MFNKTEFLGIQPTPDYLKSNLIAVDFVNDKDRIMYEFDVYVSNFNISPDFKTLTYEGWPKVYMVKLDEEKKKIELLKEYSSMYRYAFKGKKIAMAYSTNYTNMFVALYEGDTLLWKHTIKKSYMDIHGFMFTSTDKEVDSLMMIENQYSCFQIYRFDETSANDYTLKTIRNLTFQYPYIAYAVGTKEIWVQDMSNTISIFYFEANIAGMENDSKVKANTDQPLAMGIVLDYQGYYQIGKNYACYYLFLLFKIIFYHLLNHK